MMLVILECDHSLFTIHLFVFIKEGPIHLFIIRTFLDTQRARCYDHARNVYLFEYEPFAFQFAHERHYYSTTLEGMYQLVFE